MNIKHSKTIYFCGIGGIGMSALAQLLHADGKQVSGSDMSESRVTKTLQDLGITIFTPQNPAHLSDQIDLFVYTSAVPEDHPERQRARELGIPQLSYFETLGKYMKQFKNAIAVSGTHGKSTTTAIIANMLTNAGLNPTVIVGSIVKEFGSNARVGGKEYIVVEACEHQAHMLDLHPSMIVITNIEEDHLDFYRNLDHITMTFQKYVNRLPRNGVFFKNVDDSESEDIGFDGEVVRFGIEHAADVSTEDVLVSQKHQEFTSNGTRFVLNIPGRFNVYNALAAVAVARRLGIAEEVMQQTLQAFRGVWRRFEILGTYQGTTVISDYAHHPTAVRSTIKAARQFYPQERIIVVFQPHQRDRTKKLFEQFVASFHEAQFVIVQEIYDVAGREDADLRISATELVDRIEAQGKYAIYSPNVATTRERIDTIIEPGDVLLIMGAGDIYKLAEELARV
ncbi:MAG: UDP-N-acetylmuramate--L-alanine ligase [Candidatus Kerfeldbacteria bacterium]|nr:UDP-N-acetylmuramate--L-alanine ligase [Candidatus Kerfeldbacteria bacterium]